MKKNILKILICLGDFIMMFLGLLMTLSIRYWDFSYPFGPRKLFNPFLSNFFVIYCFWLVFLSIFDFYKIPPLRFSPFLIRNILFFVVLASIFSVAYFYLYPQVLVTPKLILAIDILISTMLIIFWRYIFRILFSSFFKKEKVIFIGWHPIMKDFLKSHYFQNNYSIEGILTRKDFNDNDVVRDFREIFLEKIESVKDKIRLEEVPTLILRPGLRRNKKLIRSIFKNLPFFVDYLSLINFYELTFKKIPLVLVNDFWILENISRSKNKIYIFFKRLIDIVFSIIGLLLLITLYPFLALIIKIDSKGPVFYKQQRMGKNKNSFLVNKFRTMHIRNKPQKDFWREKNKKELTFIGKFLRKIHLDELPQCINILKGEMSLVGPRAEWVRLTEKFEKEIPFYNQRHLVKPGLTGWAWIKRPASKSIKEAKDKFEYDLYYIKNQSLVFDFYILLKTIKIVFFEIFNQKRDI